MAKISARGATEVARLRVTNGAGKFPRLFVMTSDGRILTRLTGELGTGYTVATIVQSARNRNESYLRGYVLNRGYVVV
jgi:hypothetical protein